MSVGSSSATTTVARPLGEIVSDFVVLSKFRIVVMELVTVLAGFLLAASDAWSPLVLTAVLLGTGLVAASASALNQWLEVDLDAVMTRTRNRPLPAGRLSEPVALAFAALTGIAGVGMLVLLAPWPATLAGIVCWLVYVVAYTPLKTRSTLNTAVGAISGGLPILLGWLAAGGSLLQLAPWGLFGVLAFWQYPHFMAIAWRCRDDYQLAGYVMDTTVDPSGRRAGVIAVVGSVLLMLVSLLPMAMATSWLGAALYAATALAIGAVYLLSATGFAGHPDDHTSRRLLRVSLLYLPLWLLSLAWLAL
jgi:protoheme IX farnesyltransferase